MSALDVFNKPRDVDAHGAAGDALRIRAVEAASGLGHGLGLGDALVHLLVASDAVVGRKLRHGHALHGGALFGRVAGTQLGSPLLVAQLSRLVCIVVHNKMSFFVWLIEII